MIPARVGAASFAAVSSSQESANHGLKQRALIHAEGGVLKWRQGTLRMVSVRIGKLCCVIVTLTESLYFSQSLMKQVSITMDFLASPLVKHGTGSRRGNEPTLLPCIPSLPTLLFRGTESLQVSPFPVLFCSLCLSGHCLE